MSSKRRSAPAADESDPFGERSAMQRCQQLQLLGARIRFDSNSARLMQLVQAAYSGLPGHRLGAPVEDLRLQLMLSETQRHGRAEPAAPVLNQSAGLLTGATGCSSFVVLSPRERAGLVVVAPQMMRFPYHVRYELIEFAVFTLAARVQRLIPLHAACIARENRAVLLIGASGAGKSTLAMHCALGGLDFVSEDSTFIAAKTLTATGVANFVHLRADSLRWLGRSREATAIRQSPVIRRRSGVKKFEVDLRREPFRLAPLPPRISSVVFLSSRSAATERILNAVSRAEARKRLERTQAYGAALPEWRTFANNVLRLGAFELRRGRHPQDAVESLNTLLASR